jgi:hypothetical protein
MVVVVETGRRNVSFLATRANNVLRDAVPPELVRHVYVYVGSPANFLRDRPSLNGQKPHDTMSRLYLEDIRRTHRRPIAFVLAPFNRAYFDLARSEGDLVSRGVIELRPHPPTPPRAAWTGPPDTPASSGWGLALAALAVVAALGVAGFGWARSLVSGPMALALAPGFGAAGLLLVMILLERLGLPLSGAGPPAASALTAAGGYLALILARRRRLLHEQSRPGPEPPPEVA